MRRILLYNLFFLLLSMLVGCQGREAVTADMQVSHRFIVTDHSGKNPMVRIFSRTGDLQWDYPCSSSVHDVWVLKNGNVLFASKRGVKEVTPSKEVVFEYNPRLYLTSCQPLPGGRILVGENTLNRLVEIDRRGNILKTIQLTTTCESSSHQFRLARKIPNGNYLAAHEGEGVVREYDGNGKVLRTIDVEGTPYAVVRLENGNTLISCGEAAMVVEVDKDGKVVWQLKNGDIEGIELKWMAGLQRLPNGNTVMTSWFKNSDYKGYSTPQILEVTPDKKLVWTFSAPELLGSVNDIQLLDVKSDVEKFQVLR